MGKFGFGSVSGQGLSPVSFFGYLNSDQLASDIPDTIPWHTQEAHDFPHNDGDDFLEVPEDGVYVIMLTGILDNDASSQTMGGELRRRE